jgi:hypothetical protein
MSDNENIRNEVSSGVKTRFSVKIGFLRLL